MRDVSLVHFLLNRPGNSAVKHDTGTSIELGSLLEREYSMGSDMMLFWEGCGVEWT